LHKCPDALVFTAKSRIRLQLGHGQSDTHQASTQHSQPPIQTGLFQLPRMTVRALCVAGQCALRDHHRVGRKADHRGASHRRQDNSTFTAIY
jgi:hypothetical protein